MTIHSNFKFIEIFWYWIQNMEIFNGVLKCSTLDLFNKINAFSLGDELKYLGGGLYPYTQE